MSQFHSPYPQPPYPPAPMNFQQYAPTGYGDPLAPARRASVLQGILGFLTLGCGALMGAMPYLIDVVDLMHKSGVQMPEIPPGYTLEQMLRIVFGMMGVCSGMFGLAMLILCFMIRSGSRGPILTSMFLTGLVLAFLALRVVAGIVQIASNPLAIVDLIMALVLAGAFGLNMYWLAAAAKGGANAYAAQQQYLAQMYQYAQQQQYAYNQAAQGTPYGYPPQPPMPPAPTPPPNNGV